MFTTGEQKHGIQTPAPAIKLHLRCWASQLENWEDCWSIIGGCFERVTGAPMNRRGCSVSTFQTMDGPPELANRNPEIDRWRGRWMSKLIQMGGWNDQNRIKKKTITISKAYTPTKCSCVDTDVHIMTMSHQYPHVHYSLQVDAPREGPESIHTSTCMVYFMYEITEEQNRHQLSWIDLMKS